jgi:chromosome partitioning protein
MARSTAPGPAGDGRVPWYRSWAQAAPAPQERFHVEPSQEPPSPPTSFARARVLTIANQKGGVGKTTTAVSLTAALAALGARTLLVDLDPQGNATTGVGLRVEAGRPTIYEVLVGGADIDDAIEATSVRNLFVVPATLDLAGAEVELVSAFSREQQLRRALEPAREDFDIILVDCPPSLGLLTVNGLTAADGVIVPIQCEYYALEGLGALQRNADLIRTHLNPDLRIAGYVLTMLDARTRLSQQVVDEVHKHFGDLVFRTRVPRSVRLAEAPSFGQPITVFDPSSRGAQAYQRLANEVLTRLAADDEQQPAPSSKGVPAP